MKYLLIAALSLACLNVTAQTKKKKTEKPQAVEPAPVRNNTVPDNAMGIDPGIAPMPQTTVQPDVYNFVEQMPQAPFDMMDYLAKNIHYPTEARKKNAEGRVTVRFIVNEDGSISDAKVMRGIGYGCDEEAVRVIMAMPKWKSGKQNGKAVKVYFSQPIIFRLVD